MALPSEILINLRPTVDREWGLILENAEILDGGMNSVTAAFDTPSGRFVAKWVHSRAAADLTQGAEVARAMSDAGIRAGRPLLTCRGKLTASLLDGYVVLLEEVLGAPLTRSDSDLWDWGATLARVHSVCTWTKKGEFFPWLSENGRDSAREDWVRQAVDDVLDEYEALPALTWAQLHTDPEPEAFRRDVHGDIGVIDWTGSIAGPVLYDLASAVMYAGNDQAAERLIAGYQSAGVLTESELRDHLMVFRRLRGAVQAVYFSKRLDEADTTGARGQDDNAQGLKDAHTILRAAGAQMPDLS